LDSEEWDVPELERPYYFDKRGENSHTSDDLNEGKKMEVLLSLLSQEH